MKITAKELSGLHIGEVVNISDGSKTTRCS